MRSLYTVVPVVVVMTLDLTKLQMANYDIWLADSRASTTAVISASGAAAALAPPVHTAEDSLLAEAWLSPAGVRPTLERYFARFSKDRVVARRVARAVAREARRQNIPPSLVAAVLVTENTQLDPEAQSPVGAQGLMQVMPMHAGALGCNSDDLVDIDSNICHGTTILARNLRWTKSSTTALLRYNGCVKGVNTPDCHRYPSRVLARASRIRHEILASTNALASYEPAQPEVVKPVRMSS